MSKVSWRIETLRGGDAIRYLKDLAELRIRVFRDFPYLYDGDFEYEKKYLNTYFSCPESFVALCRVEDRIVGAATAIPMKYEEESFKSPFLRDGLDPSKICYFGESVLLPEYRGLGIGKAFMKARIDFAHSYPEVQYAVFCAVVRDADHPKQPIGYRPLNSFWEGMGFKMLPGMETKYSWKEIGESQESEKKMQFWINELRRPV